MKSITKHKPFEEIQAQLEPFDRIFVAGCGTCATLTETGGVDQVREMCDHLNELGKRISGSTVIPTACDEMTSEVMKEYNRAIGDANCILVMSCALGVHRINLYIDRPVIPALDTLFIAVENTPGNFQEVCAQCGQCVLGETAGICPITTCHKGLVNGPCGGTNDGKCEIDREKDCAWTLIYNRLKAQDRLYLMKNYKPPHNFQVTPRPGVLRIS
ncbi:MAG: methylenetetrahydrofolate reductase C-terminal domain-containing protein [Dehalococcoidales bacterium]|nr:MAG: methylenetetrahydrofolate reductase C-terminal domain-containing protein [Dehalococcoidales bacterium]